LNQNRIPQIINDNERLLRNIYKPIHFHKKRTETLISYAFKPRSSQIDLSVLRLEYAELSFCVQNANNFASATREFAGFAIIKNKEVYDIGLTTEFTPLENIPMHADILFPKEEIELGEPQLSRISELAQDLLDKARFYDVNIISNKESLL
jgi:hypothetical protein